MIEVHELEPFTFGVATHRQDCLRLNNVGFIIRNLEQFVG